MNKKYFIGGAMILAFGLLLTVKCNKCSVPDDSLLIKKSTLDSINMIANSKPDTIIKTDTIRPKAIIRWYEKEISIIAKDSVRHDSLRTDEVAIYITDSLTSRKIGYELFVPKTITRTIEITKDVPFVIVKEAEQKKWYAMGGIGNGISVEIGRTVKAYDYGLQILRFDSKNCILLKTGIRF